METLQIINIILLERNRDPNWPSGKFTTVRNKIRKRFSSDDNVAMLDMYQDTPKIKLTKRKDPKTLPYNIAAIKVQWRCALLDKKKEVVVVCMDKFNDSVVIKVTGTMVISVHVSGTISEELVVEMYKQFHISGDRNNYAGDKDEVKEMALSTNSDI